MACCVSHAAEPTTTPSPAFSPVLAASERDSDAHSAHMDECREMQCSTRPMAGHLHLSVRCTRRSKGRSFGRTLLVLLLDSPRYIDFERLALSRSSVFIRSLFVDRQLSDLLRQFLRIFVTRCILFLTL